MDTVEFRQYWPLFFSSLLNVIKQATFVLLEKCHFELLLVLFEAWKADALLMENVTPWKSDNLSAELVVLFLLILITIANIDCTYNFPCNIQPLYLSFHL